MVNYYVTMRSPDSRERNVVITGIGMVSPLGLSFNESFNNAVAGKSGISRIPDGYFPDPQKVPVHAYGRIHDFDPKTAFSWATDKEARGAIRRSHRSAQLAIAASYEALLQAGLIDQNGRLTADIDPETIGLIIGTGFGGTAAIPEHTRSFDQTGVAPPLGVLEAEIETVATNPGRIFGVQGETATVGAACATGLKAIRMAANEIMLGDAEMMIAGATEAPLETPLSIAYYDRLRAVSRNTDPERASRPLDENHDGFVMSEGAGIVILEEEQHAIARGRQPLARLSGWGKSSDAEHATNPNKDGRGLQRALRQVHTRLGGIPEGEIVYVAHATSTPVGDASELKALQILYPDQFDRLTVTPPKSSIGHTMGAAGAVQLGLGLGALIHRIVPPALNLDNQIPPREIFVPRQAHTLKNGEITVINGALGFGGLNEATAMQRWREPQRKLYQGI